MFRVEEELDKPVQFGLVSPVHSKKWTVNCVFPSRRMVTCDEIQEKSKERKPDNPGHGKDSNSQRDKPSRTTCHNNPPELQPGGLFF